MKRMIPLVFKYCQLLDGLSTLLASGAITKTVAYPSIDIFELMHNAD